MLKGKISWLIMENIIYCICDKINMVVAILIILFFQGSILDIQNIQYTARGRYFCEAFNEVGYDRRDIVITVQRK